MKKPSDKTEGLKILVINLEDYYFLWFFFLYLDKENTTIWR